MKRAIFLSSVNSGSVKLLKDYVDPAKRAPTEKRATRYLATTSFFARQGRSASKTNFESVYFSKGLIDVPLFF